MADTLIPVKAKYNSEGTDVTSLGEYETNEKIPVAYIPSTEGTAVISTGETGTVKFLRVDGDGTCSWQITPDSNTTYTATGVLSISGSNVISSTAEANVTNTAITTVDQSWSGSQRGTPSVVTDGTLDLTSANNFKYTPGAADNLEFSGEASSAGQSGFITIINTTPYVISLGSEVKKGASWDVSTAGTYLVSYYCDGTNVYVSASEALA